MLMFPDLRQFVETTLLAVAALLPIVNPLGGAPIYLAKTVDLTSSEHDELAKRVAVNSFLLLIASALIGAYVLDFFGLSIPIVQVGGGLVVSSIAWTMLNEPDQVAPTKQDAARAMGASDLRRRAFYPLTMPLTVGPGSISVAITLGANRAHTALRPLIIDVSGHLAGIIIVAISVFLCYRYAEPILRKLGDVGTVVVTRLTAFILLCIGVQIVWNGVSALVETLHLASRAG
jgi:multiple antibiotic resistance protein